MLQVLVPQLGSAAQASLPYDDPMGRLADDGGGVLLHHAS